jgi:hypothetical protein
MRFGLCHVRSTILAPGRPRTPHGAVVASAEPVIHTATQETSGVVSSRRKQRRARCTAFYSEAAIFCCHPWLWPFVVTRFRYILQK